jgi:hypothetical protein
VHPVARIEKASRTMATNLRSFPALDLTRFDLSRLDLSRFDLSRLDLGKLDPRAHLPAGQGDEVAGKIAALARDAAYVVIGFSVLTVQQAQVRRRELVDSLSERRAVRQLGITRDQIEDLVARVETRLAKLDDRLVGVEGRIDAAVQSAVERLPEQAGTLVDQAHHVVKAARKQVRSLVRPAA